VRETSSPFSKTLDTVLEGTHKQEEHELLVLFVSLVDREIERTGKEIANAEERCEEEDAEDDEEEEEEEEELEEEEDEEEEEEEETEDEEEEELEESVLPMVSETVLEFVFDVETEEV
jgi:hypothetical protein